jgi:electron-transferring-flavoprotein dehydrogenase
VPKLTLTSQANQNHHHLSRWRARALSNASERIEYDILLVGGSPGNFALAHRLLQLAKANPSVSFTMAILEKAREFGGHNVSGAISNPHVIEKLFPNYQELGFPTEGVCTESHFSVLGVENMWDIPGFVLPKELDKTGSLVLTLSHVVAWMAKHLETVAKDVPNVTVDMFPGFAAHEVIYDGDVVVGVRVGDSGHPIEDFIYGNVTVLGDKGFISQDVLTKFNLRDTAQLWSVGVKEVWDVEDDLSGKVWHTLGYPIMDGTFGGGFVYGMNNKRLTIGMVISLDSPNPNINPQQRLQDLKKHPWLQKLLKGGKLLKYGAAILPEGGFYSLPKQYSVSGAMFVGDALGVLNVMKLAGIDMSMESGYQAAEVLMDCLKANDFSQVALSAYKSKLDKTFVVRDLYRSRYFRHTFMENPKLLGDYLPKIAESIDSTGLPILGGLKIGLSNPFGSLLDAFRAKQLIEGLVDLGPISYKPCHEHIIPGFKTTIPSPKTFDKDTVFSREDAVFYANTKYHEGNEHIDEFQADTCVACIQKYDALGQETPCVSDCTAEVHRVDVLDGLRKHGMSLENCVQCRTCEIVCPEVNLRVKPAYQGSGPDFMGL